MMNEDACEEIQFPVMLGVFHFFLWLITGQKRIVEKRWQLFVSHASQDFQYMVGKWIKRFKNCRDLCLKLVFGALLCMLSCQWN